VKLLESVDVRTLTRADVPQMARLMNSHYARQRKESYFHWQYFASAYPTAVAGAFDGETLIGMFGLQKRRLTGGAKAGQAIDMIVDPAWRGRGLFKALGEKAAEAFSDLDLFCVLPNSAGRAAVEKHFQWMTLTKINTWRLSRVAKRQTQEGQARQREMNQLEAFVYEPETLDWRFDRHPEFTYRRITSGADSSAMVKVFTDKTAGKTYGDIVNFYCADDRGLGPLLGQACEYLFSQKVDAVMTWAMPHDYAAHMLPTLGFTEEQQERYFCVKVLNSDYQHLTQFSRWRLVQSDAEHF